MAKKSNKPLQFGLGTLLGVMMLVCIHTAVLAGLLRGDSDRTSVMIYVLLAVAAPMGLMLLVSGWLTVQKWLARRRRTKAQRDEVL